MNESIETPEDQSDPVEIKEALTLVREHDPSLSAPKLEGGAFDLSQLSNASRKKLQEAAEIERDKERAIENLNRKHIIKEYAIEQAKESFLPITSDRRWKMGDITTKGQDFLIYFIVSHYGPIRSDTMNREHRLHNGLLCNSLMRLKQYGLIEEKEGKWRTA